MQSKKLRIVRAFIDKTFGDHRRRSHGHSRPSGDDDNDKDNNDDDDGKGKGSSNGSSGDVLLQKKAFSSGSSGLPASSEIAELRLKVKDLTTSRRELEKVNARLEKVAEDAGRATREAQEAQALARRATPALDLGDTPEERAEVHRLVAADRPRDEGQPAKCSH